MTVRSINPQREQPLSVAVIGYGYWGPNLVRNVIERPELHFAGLCERDPARAKAFHDQGPGRPGLHGARRRCWPTRPSTP